MSTYSRRDIRSLIFHVLYAADSYNYDVPVPALIEMMNQGFELSLETDGEIAQVAYGVIKERHTLDDIIQKHLVNWRIERVGCCTKLILRMALWEMHHTDTHSTVVINEAIELAKAFSEKDAHRFVNGLLDEVVKAMAERDQALQEVNPD